MRVLFLEITVYVREMAYAWFSWVRTVYACGHWWWEIVQLPKDHRFDLFNGPSTDYWRGDKMDVDVKSSKGLPGQLMPGSPAKLFCGNLWEKVINRKREAPQQASCATENDATAAAAENTQTWEEQLVATGALQDEMDQEQPEPDLHDYRFFVCWFLL